MVYNGHQPSPGTAEWGRDKTTLDPAPQGGLKKRRNRMGKFGWSLPPGCSMNDIDAAYGDQPTPAEVFYDHGKLTEDEKKVWMRVFDFSDELQTLIEKAISWGYEQGYQQGMCDEGQSRDHEDSKPKASEE